MADYTEFGLHLSLVSADPAIVYVGSDNLIHKIFSDGSTPLQRIFDVFDAPVTLIVSPWWYMLERKEAWANLGQSFREVKQTRRDVDIVVACNDLDEPRYARELGFDGLLCHQNGFVQDYYYHPDPSARKLYDAIYNARLVKWKRHALCREITSVAFLYSRWGEDGEPYRLGLVEDMPHAVFLNGPATSEHRQLQGEELRQAYTAARVGLCLSASEGAMFASIEPLLCGLPVVTTPSRGGRTWMFEDAFCWTVDADSHAVAEATRALSEANFKPEMIRAATMRKVEIARRTFEAVVAGIQHRAGKTITAETDAARLRQTWCGMKFTKLSDLRLQYQKMLAERT